MSDDTNYYGVAWAYNGPHGVSPKTFVRRLYEAVERAGETTFPSAVRVMGADSFWRQGVRVAESIRWECENTPVPLRQAPGRVVGHWSLGGDSGQLQPVRVPQGLPWPRVDFSGMISSGNVSALVAGEPTSSVALETWKEDLLAMESSPPWVYWALQGARFELEQELQQVSWDDKTVSQWWRLVSCLVENTALPGRHFDVGFGDKGVEIRELPVSSLQTRQATLKTLCMHLPLHLRRPAKLSGLDGVSGGGTSRDVELIDELLRTWVTPARFWSLRKTLYVQRLTSTFSERTLSDFRALPKASAYKALEKMASGPMGFFNSDPLTSLPKLHAHVPDWPGWMAFLKVLEPTGLLPTESVGFMASLDAAHLNERLGVASVATPRRRF